MLKSQERMNWQKLDKIWKNYKIDPQEYALKTKQNQDIRVA